MRLLRLIVLILMGVIMAGRAHADALWLCRDLPQAVLASQETAVRSHVYGIDGSITMLQAGAKPAAAGDCALWTSA